MHHHQLLWTLSQTILIWGQILAFRYLVLSTTKGDSCCSGFAVIHHNHHDWMLQWRIRYSRSSSGSDIYLRSTSPQYHFSAFQSRRLTSTGIASHNNNIHILNRDRRLLTSQQQLPPKRNFLRLSKLSQSSWYRLSCTTSSINNNGHLNILSMTTGSTNSNTEVKSTAASSITTQQQVRAQLTNDIQQCGRTIVNGGLVAFPTETVYGLGGYAFDCVALQQIFIVKERPTTDPLIVHVLSSNNAYPLWEATSTNTSTTSTTNSTTSSTTNIVDGTTVNNQKNIEQQILQALCETFWPGPLTIVAKAADQAFPKRQQNQNDDASGSDSKDSNNAMDQDLNVVLSLLTANTGYIAIRSPRHAVARAVLQAATDMAVDNNGTTSNNLENTNRNDHLLSLFGGGYIAAPSANKFGHVSPTTAQHVFDDLQYESVLIYHDDDNHRCDVGVESTVVKVECFAEPVTCDENDQNTTVITSSMYYVTILRQGAVSLQDITFCLHNAGLLVPQNKNIFVTSNIQRRTNENEANVAPGQTIRHYSPNVPSYLVSSACIQEYNDLMKKKEETIASSTAPNATELKYEMDDYSKFLSTAVIIDYGQQLVSCRDAVLAYYDLSEQFNSHHAAQILFSTLRIAETIPNATKILFPQYLMSGMSSNHHSNNRDDNNFDRNTTTTATSSNNTNDALTLALQDRLTRAASGVVLDKFIDSTL